MLDAVILLEHSGSSHLCSQAFPPLRPSLACCPAPSLPSVPLTRRPHSALPGPHASSSCWSPAQLRRRLVPCPWARPPQALPRTPEGTPGGDVAPWAGRRQPQGHRPASGSSACPRPRPACQTRPGPVPQPCSGQRSAPRVGGLVTLACRRPRRRLAPSRVGRSARASAFPAAPPPHSPGAWGRAWHTGRAQYCVSTIVSLRKRNYFFSQTRNVSSISH